MGLFSLQEEQGKKDLFLLTSSYSELQDDASKYEFHSNIYYQIPDLKMYICSNLKPWNAYFNFNLLFHLFRFYRSVFFFKSRKKRESWSYAFIQKQLNYLI